MMALRSFGVSRRETVLSNGVRLVVFERPGQPVYLQAAFLAGSRFDPVGREGLAHFLEHMLVAGTKNFPSKDKLAAFIEQFGGEFSAFTGSEVLSINTAIGDPTDFKQAVRVLSEAIKYPLMAPKTVETARGSILRELGDKKSNPERMLWEVWRRLFFQGTKVGRSTLGTDVTINSISRDDIIRFQSDMLVSGRLALVVAGGVTLNQAQDLAEANLLVGNSERFTLEEIYRTPL